MYKFIFLNDKDVVVYESVGSYKTRSIALQLGNNFFDPIRFPDVVKIDSKFIN